jgi:hypothetical protein
MGSLQQQLMRISDENEKLKSRLASVSTEYKKLQTHLMSVLHQQKQQRPHYSLTRPNDPAANPMMPNHIINSYNHNHNHNHMIITKDGSKPTSIADHLHCSANTSLSLSTVIHR